MNIYVDLYKLQRLSGGSYVDVLQVQGVQVLIVSLPQDRRPPLPGDGAGQHGALADGYRGDAHFLVVGQVEQVHVCGQEGQKHGRETEEV